ncbi:hypothetical protein B0T26DRAFT_295410 [Lasiosphaeria miniovina]|uniref:Uncharacterized protein n=1 Tax=Lasiosphaeria miniovina TaxID=1954250 RepID=A0AA40AK67_9PEZI|nr:uncharacterized protein B0T26DRAFT_295410 [Lasiosphaeria miniovina]KAK0717371.1 hypothetical protein B0T26DRAFT_295410 [Lasiosphaeria miniovina]
MLSIFPEMNHNGLAALSVTIAADADATITGFGTPFRNTQDPKVDRWVNDNAPIVGDTTLLDILTSKEFTLVVHQAPNTLTHQWQTLQAPFEYPYGTEHSFDRKKLDRLRALYAQHKGPQFRHACVYDDENSQVAVVTQSCIQDVFWLHEAAREILATKWRVYFVPTTTIEHGAEARSFYVVVPPTAEWRTAHNAAWRRLVKGEKVYLHLYPSSDNEGRSSKRWECTILSHLGNHGALASHPTAAHELVLTTVRRDTPMADSGEAQTLAVFGSRDQANRALKSSAAN